MSGLDHAIALHRAGQLAEAEAAYLSWLRSHPGDPDANFYLGGLRQQQGLPGEAVALFQQVLAQDPERVDAWVNLGVAQRSRGELSIASACLERAIALEPGSAVAHYNLGVVLQDRRMSAEALRELDAAIALRPGHAGSHCNRGTVLAALNRDIEALESFDGALTLEPEHALARHNKGLALLRLGRFRDAWPQCEYRWKRPGAAAYRHGATPPWNGTDTLRGKRILFWSEQGFGDTLQFCRFANVLADRGAAVLLEVQKPLRTLLGELEGVAQCFAQGEPLPACDFQMPLLSAPMALQTDAGSIPARVPYLLPPPARVESVRPYLGDPDGLPRVGIVCSGSRTHVNDANRSIPLARFAALFGRARLFLLQTDVHAADTEALAASPIRDLRPILRDFRDTAAVISHLDLVISVDTAVAHLAGAMGKPVWILLPFAPDWRWMQERDDSPWYPTARLFRQRQPGDWSHVLARLVAQFDERSHLTQDSP